MRLTQFSDYALRMLMYVAAQPGRLITIEETAQAFGISRNHLMKVANLLTRNGYLQAVRGRNGGLSLAQPPQRIGLGALLRVTEPDFTLVECFGGGACSITPACRLRGELRRALAAFLAHMDTCTLDDLLLPPRAFAPAAAKGGRGGGDDRRGATPAAQPRGRRASGSALSVRPAAPARPRGSASAPR